MSTSSSKAKRKPPNDGERGSESVIFISHPVYTHEEHVKKSHRSNTKAEISDKNLYDLETTSSPVIYPIKNAGQNQTTGLVDSTLNHKDRI